MAWPVHSFPSLLAHLGTIVRNWVRPSGKDVPPFTMVTKPNPLQRRTRAWRPSRDGRPCWLHAPHNSEVVPYRP